MKKMCTSAEQTINLPNHTAFAHFRQVKIAAAIAAATDGSLLAEGLAVGALVLGGVDLMSAHQDPIQRAVVLILAVISTLLDGAFNALVGMTVHRVSSFCLIQQ